VLVFGFEQASHPTSAGAGDANVAASAPQRDSLTHYCFDDLVGDAFVGEFEVPLWIFKRRIENGVFDDDLLHGDWFWETEGTRAGGSSGLR